MPAFRHQSLNAQGKTIQGFIEAESLRSARQQLRSQKLLPLEVSLTQSAQNLPFWQRPLGRRGAFSRADLVVWTRQLAGLLEAGLPLEKALSALEEETSRPAQRMLQAQLRTEVHGGAALARAMQVAPSTFSSMYVSVVAAGEQTGQLPQVMNSLADSLESEQALQQKVWGAALYPLIVSVVALLMVVFLMSSVVPQVAVVFVNQQQTLPWITRFMLGASSLLREYGVLLLVLLVLAGIALRILLKRPAWRLRWDAYSLQLPLLGRWLRNYHSARFAATLGLLVSAGVPMLKALHTATETLGNRLLQQHARRVMDMVREGTPLGATLAHTENFPSLLVMFARLGEQTGNLGPLLLRAAAQLSSEVQRRALYATTLLEPILVVLMGLVVMAIVMAVLLPIMQLNQMV